MAEELGFYKMSYVGERIAYHGGSRPNHFYKIDIYDQNGTLINSVEKEASKAMGYTDCLDDFGYKILFPER